MDKHPFSYTWAKCLKLFRMEKEKNKTTQRGIQTFHVSRIFCHDRSRQKTSLSWLLQNNRRSKSYLHFRRHKIQRRIREGFMTKTVAICQARMSSTRLPGKVMKDLAGRPVIDWVVEAAKHAPGVDEVIVATSIEPADDVIAEWATHKGVALYRGSLTDVMSRFVGAANQTNADIIVRLTCDCPLLDPNVIGEVIKLREMRGVQYATNTDPASFPDGEDTEVFTRGTLESANREATRGTDRDTVTRFMARNRHRFHAVNLVCSLPNLVRERWVLDSPEDYEFILEIAKRLGNGRNPPSYLQILSLLDKEPSLRTINNMYSRNERFYEALAAEGALSKRSYHNSKMMLAKAEALIPLGTQTFSKSKLMFPEGAAPLFVTHGDGAYVFDVDGNDYVDCVGGLLPNILGYRDPDVGMAIRDQLSSGISFSLATPLEEKLAALLHKHIPSAEMVKFGKNGSDVTTAAVRLARHITDRDVVGVGGYHGWHDWSMANTARNNGIPKVVRLLSDPLNKWIDEIQDWCAVVVEPEFHAKEELELLRTACTRTGTLLIFDEIITGFR